LDNADVCGILCKAGGSGLGYEGEVEAADVLADEVMDVDEMEVEVVEALGLGLTEAFDFRRIALDVESMHAHLSY